MDYGTVSLQINELLRQKGISKNRICKDLDIPRTNFNKYCRNEFQRIDVGLICKLCYYLEVEIEGLVVYRRPDSDGNSD